MTIPLTVFDCFFPLYPNSVRYVNPYSLIRRYDKNRIINNSTPILPNRTTFSQSSFTVFGCVPSFSPKFMLKGYFGNITNVAANNITVSSSIASSVKNQHFLLSTFCLNFSMFMQIFLKLNFTSNFILHKSHSIPSFPIFANYRSLFVESDLLIHSVKHFQ